MERALEILGTPGQFASTYKSIAIPSWERSEFQGRLFPQITGMGFVKFYLRFLKIHSKLISCVHDVHCFFYILLFFTLNVYENYAVHRHLVHTAYQYCIWTMTTRLPVTLFMILSPEETDLIGSSCWPGKLSCRLVCTAVTLHIAQLFWL